MTFRPGSSLSCDFPFGVEGQDRICVVQIQTTDGIILMEGASIRASNIYLNSSLAPIIISEGASIVADGLGHGSGIGSWANQYSSTSAQIGGWCGGAGGSCSNAYQMKTKGDGSYPLRPVGTSIPPGPDHEGAITNRQIDPHHWPLQYMFDSVNAFSDLFGGGVIFTVHPQSNASDSIQRVCNGGGAVTILTDSYVTVDGNISANGQQPCYLTGELGSPPADPTSCKPCNDYAGDPHRRGCSGGSGAAGGTVVIRAGGWPVPVNGSGHVTANGAPADGICHPNAGGASGGGGGRIEVPMSAEDVVNRLKVAAVGGGSHNPNDASGGTSCTYGGAGTVLQVRAAHDANPELRQITIAQTNEAASLASSLTTIVGDHGDGDNTPYPSPLRQVDVLSLQNGAHLSVPATENDGILTVRDSISMDTNSLLECLHVNARQLTVQGSSSLTTSVVGQTQQVQFVINVSTLQLGPQSDISEASQIYVQDGAIIEGQLWARSSMDIFAGGSLRVGILGSIRANELTLAVAERLEVKGQVQASNLPKELKPGDDFNLGLLNCSASKDSRVMLDISAEQLIITASSVIASSVIRVCAHTVQIAGTVSATSLGYTKGSGPGAPEGCSASDDASVGAGAGHASMGASAGFNQTLCAGGDPYGTDECACSAGSGGGGHNGGSGGGIISIVASDSITLSDDAYVTADGGSNTFAGFEDQAVGGSSGGGAGGSILISSASLMAEAGTKRVWKGQVSAIGGAGTCSAVPSERGGGGSGGIVRLLPMLGESDWRDPPQVPWSQINTRVLVDGGCQTSSACAEGTDSNSTCNVGGKGNFSWIACRPGRYGFACQPCETGKFKPDWGSHNCTPCPEGQHQPFTGQTDCMACPPGLAAMKPQTVTCEPCSQPRMYANETTGTCEPCPPAPMNAKIQSDCAPGDGSKFECSCKVVCEAAAVQLWDGGPCGPYLDVMFLSPPMGEGGRAALLTVPFLLLASLLIHLSYRIVGSSTHFIEGMRRPIAHAPPSSVDPYYRPRQQRSRAPKKSRRRRGLLDDDGSAVAIEMQAPYSSKAGSCGAGSGGRAEGARPPPSDSTLHAFDAAMSRGDRTDALVSVFGAGTPHMESLRHEVLWDELRRRDRVHVKRIHLLGWNSSAQPWILPLLTEGRKRLLQDEGYANLAHVVDGANKWAQWETALYFLLVVSLPPAAAQFAWWRRRAHFHASRLLVESAARGESAEQLWKSIKALVEDFHVEFCCSESAEHAWLDVFSTIEQKDLELTPQKVVAAVRGGSGGRGAAALPVEASAALRKDGEEAEAMMRSALDKINAGTGAGAAAPAEAVPTEGYTDLTTLAAQSGALRLGWGGKGDEGAAAAGMGSLTPTVDFLDPDERASDVRAWLPLSGLCSFLSPGALDPGDFLTHTALYDAFGPSTVAVINSLNLLLLRLDRSSADWRIALDDVLRFIEALNEHLLAASVQATAPVVSYKERHSSLRCASSKDGASSRRSDLSGRSSKNLSIKENAVGVEDSVEAVDGDGGAPERPLLALLHQKVRADDPASTERHQPLVLALAYGAPSTWELAHGQELLQAGEVDALEIGGEFRPLPPKEGVALKKRVWAQVSAAARWLVAYGHAPIHSYTMRAAAVLLLLQLLDMALTTVLLGSMCSPAGSVTGAMGCTMTLLFFPLACVITPIYGTYTTCRVLFYDRQIAWRADRFVDPKAMSRSSPSNLVRALRVVSLWNASSLLNTFIALGYVLPAQSRRLFVSDSPALLPLALIATKLVVAQALKVLASSTGLVRGAYGLLVALVRDRGHPKARGTPAASSLERPEDP